MRHATQLVMLGLVAALGIWGAGPVQSAEITVFLNQATESGVRELAAGFEKATGHKVDVSFQGGPALIHWVEAGAHWPDAGHGAPKPGAGGVWWNQWRFGGIFLGPADAIGCFTVHANWKFLRPPAA